MYTRPNNIRRQRIQSEIEDVKKQSHEIWSKLNNGKNFAEIGVSKREYQDLYRREDDLKDYLENLPLEPEVGMGATIGFNGDAYPYTIHKIEEKDGKVVKIWASRDKHEYKGKPIEHGQEYDQSKFEFTNNRPETEWSTYTLRRDGTYVQTSAKIRDVWNTLQLGVRLYLQNPSF